MHEPIFLDIKMFESNGRDVVERSKKQLLAWMHALTAHDRIFIDSNQSRIPMLYESGAQYELDQKAWRDIPRVIETRRGNCKDFAAWRCAELRAARIDCKPYLVWIRDDDGFWNFHAVVLREKEPTKFLPKMLVTPNGKRTVFPWRNEGWIEDPSLVLGMSWNEAK